LFIIVCDLRSSLRQKIDPAGTPSASLIKSYTRAQEKRKQSCWTGTPL